MRKTFIIFSFFISLTVQPVFAALPGSLDTAFGNGGKIFTVFDGQNFHTAGNVIKRQADGKIVMACNVGNFLLCLARYNADGSLDSSFGSGGKVLINLPEGYEKFRDMALQPDGKIIVTGWYRYSIPGPIYGVGFLLRYNSNGTLDPSFDGDGIKYLDTLGGHDMDAIAIQPDGKIVAAGHEQDTLLVVRLNSNGSLDPAFSDDGVASRGLSSCYVDSVVLQSDGKIITSGTGELPSAWFAARHNSDGSADTSFDGDGIVFTQLGTNGVSSRASAIQPDGKLLIAGWMAPGDGSDVVNIAVARYNVNGSLDTTFDGDGKVVRHVSAPNRYDWAEDVVLQPDGKILVLANVGAIPRSQPAEARLGLLRLNIDGSPDTTFGLDGVTTLHVEGAGDSVSSMVLQQNGKLLVAGTASTGVLIDPGKFCLLRFNTQAQPTLDFDGDGKTDISLFRPSSGEWRVTRSSNGSSYARPFGNSADKIAPADFTGDSKADFALFRPSDGNWYIMRSENSTFYALPYGANGDIPAPADFDGDGKADVTVFRPSNGLWISLRSSNEQSTILQFGRNEDIPVPADYDGDGKADISVYRPSAGAWYTKRSTTGAFFGAPFGASGDKPVPGDYTGDGKADFAIFRPSTGFWYVLRSENQSYYGAPFGVSTDIPTIGDYDGDGKNDFAVYRANTRNWFIQRSTAGFIAAQFGDPGDRPVPAYYLP